MGYFFNNMKYQWLSLFVPVFVWSYAEVPLFDWIKEVFEQSRNNYDKVGHFAQDFMPAILAREILIGKHILQGAKIWLNYIMISSLGENNSYIIHTFDI